MEVLTPVSQEQLKKTLRELHQALESADSVDPALHAPLRATMDEIQELLDASSGEGHSGEHPLADRVSDLAVDFEAAHPTIAGTLNRLTHLLSSMGV